jgi:hypothetical protein
MIPAEARSESHLFAVDAVMPDSLASSCITIGFAVLLLLR